MDDYGTLNTELISKLWEIVESLTKLNKLTLDILAQYINVDDYEHMMAKILEGYDVEIE